METELEMSLDDQDHDGVWNPSDICPDTKLGKVVNLQVAEILYLPANNITVKKKKMQVKMKL